MSRLPPNPELDKSNDPSYNNLDISVKHSTLMNKNLFTMTPRSPSMDLSENLGINNNLFDSSQPINSGDHDAIG